MKASSAKENTKEVKGFKRVKCLGAFNMTAPSKYFFIPAAYCFAATWIPIYKAADLTRNKD